MPAARGTDVTVSDYEIRGWTTPGPQGAAGATYASVQQALNRWEPLKRLSWEHFLQGSYANHTNTRGDSDVDIVVMLTTDYVPDLSLLPAADKARHEARSIPASVGAAPFRDIVHVALTNYYGSDAVISKDKCLRVPKRDGYVDADVVPALQLLRYESFPEYGQPRVIEGIAIFPRSGGRIVNYPKEHIKNGERKNGATLGAYKETVRQVKRLRRKAVSDGLVGPSDAPGYLLECLVFNAPNSLFGGDEALRVRKVVGWLDGHSANDLLTSMRSCDLIHMLFATDPGNHDPRTAKRVLSTLAGML